MKNQNFIEKLLKHFSHKPTKEQKKWIEDLNERGYFAKCVKGLDEIIETIDSYMTKNQSIRWLYEEGK